MTPPTARTTPTALRPAEDELGGPGFNPTTDFVLPTPTPGGANWGPATLERVSTEVRELIALLRRVESTDPPARQSVTPRQTAARTADQ